MIRERSLKEYCNGEFEKIENYEQAINDKTQTWHLHHRLELTLNGEFAHTREELKRMNMYYHRPYFELIFLTSEEHNKIHNKGRSEETKQKIAKFNKYRNLGKHFTEEHKRKLSESNKGKHGLKYKNIK